MKAIIFSHDRGGSVVMDCEGCFYFVKGYTSHPIGTELEIETEIVTETITGAKTRAQTKTQSNFINIRNLKNLKRIAVVAACFLAVLSLSYFGLVMDNMNYWNYDGGGFHLIEDEVPLGAPPVSRSASGSYAEPQVSAEIAVEFIIFRYITITINDNGETYAQSFRELNRSSEGTYTVKSGEGVYTVYVTFSKDSVLTAKITDFEFF